MSILLKLLYSFHIILIKIFTKIFYKSFLKLPLFQGKRMRRVKTLILKKDKRKEEITLPHTKLCISTVIKIGTGGGKIHRSME